ncbi:MAG: hypothetical protein EP329_18855, partial [Deltaproteobacteria bacterium]
MQARRAKTLWGAGSAGLAALACLWLALAPIADRGPSAWQSDTGADDAALFAALGATPAPAIEVGEQDATAGSLEQLWRPVERTSRETRETKAEATARVVDTPPAWTPSAPWRSP